MPSVDAVADAMGARRVHRLIVTADFNASYGDCGRLQRRPVVVSGLPLWSVLSPRERVAVLSHEFAHGTNGDSLRHGFMSGAVARLVSCDDAGVRQLRRDPLQSDLRRGFDRLYVPRPSGAWRSRAQEAESLADLRGAAIAGTEARVGTKRKAGLSRYMKPVLDPIAYRLPGQDGNFFPAFRRLTGQLPELELDR